MHQIAQVTNTNSISGVGYMNVPCAILSSFFFLNMYEYFFIIKAEKKCGAGEDF